MKLVSFKYTKPKDGSVSERLLLAMSEPGTSNKYAGIDLSELDPNDATNFVKEVVDAHNNYLELVREIQARYDLKFAYKQFLEAGVSELVEI